jgi:transposase
MSCNSIPHLLAHPVYSISVRTRSHRYLTERRQGHTKRSQLLVMSAPVNIRLCSTLRDGRRGSSGRRRWNERSSKDFPCSVRKHSLSLPLLFSLPTDLLREDVTGESTLLTLIRASPQPRCPCPMGGHTSSRLQSRDTRRRSALPGQGQSGRLWLRVRRVFCANRPCSRQTFAEPFPSVAPASARRTSRQMETLCEMAFARGGRAGARVARFLSLPVSFLTVRRVLRRTRSAGFDTPEVLGVDDGAWRRGDHSGTILVDLHTPRPIDLVPDREAETVAQWRREHPGVKGVSRDRASGSAQGAKKGAPDAIHVADRSPLVANRRDTVQRVVDRERPCVPALQKGERTAAPEPPGERSVRKQEVQKEEARPERERMPRTRTETRRQVRRGRRDERSQAVVELHQQGLGERAIAPETGLSRHTVHRDVDGGTFPDAGPRKTRRSP